MSKLRSTYKIFPEHRLIIEFHKGILEVDTYIEFKKKLAIDTLFEANMNYLIHFKEVTFKTTSEDILRFIDFMKTQEEKIGKRRLAFITNTPNQVVSTTIYKSLQNDLMQEVEIFSTNSEAIKWLLQKPVENNHLLEILSSIKNSFN